jgi:hypothetical protein
MIMDEFKVRLVGTCLNAIQNTSTQVDFVLVGYTGCVQILNKGVNRPFKSYASEEFKNWMLTNISSCHPTWGGVASWVNIAWNKMTEETIENTWKYVGHFLWGEFGDQSLEPAPNTESVLVEVWEQEPTAYNDDGDDDNGTIDNEDEGIEELEPLFRDGCPLRSNLLDMDDEDLIFVMDLASQEFSNGNGERDEACHGESASV